MPDLQLAKKRSNADHVSDKESNLEDTDYISLLEAARSLKEIVLDLTQSGSNLKIQDKSGWTVLQLAIQYNHLEIASLLVEHGKPRRQNTTPLCCSS